MKILLVNYEWKSQGGGAGLGTYNMAREFCNMGHQVSILCGWDYRYGEPEKIYGVKEYFVKVKKKNIQQSTPMGLVEFILRGMIEIYKLTRKEKYDIIQFYFSIPTGILKYAVHGRVPYVISLRGMDIPGLNTKYRLFSKITAQLNYSITRKAAAVTSLSAEAGKYYTRFASDIHIDVIPNAIEYSLYHQKKRYSCRITKFIAVSRLTAIKNLDLLIEAFSIVHKEYPDIILDIWGEGKERDKLSKLIETNDAKSYIHLQGYADRAELIERLPQYDVFSLVTAGDSFGIVFLEAMSAGLPVICARAGGPMEVIVENETGIFVEPNDLQDTILGIKYCIENPQVMMEMGRKGRKRVEEYYSIEHVAKEHIKLYERCLENVVNT